MNHQPYPILTSAGPCPPADHPEAILLWLHVQHRCQGRLDRGGERHDPFWRRIDEKRDERLRLAVSLGADPAWERWVTRMADILGLDLAGKGKDEQIDAVVCAFVPMRFHLSAALEEIGEIDRAAEVLVQAY